MAPVRIFVCDVCFTETRYFGWEDAPSGIYCPQHSPNNTKPNYAEVCLPCRKAFNAAFTLTYKQLAPEARP